MPIKHYETGDSSYDIYEYPGTVPELDLTSDPWNLRDGQASIVMGADTRFTGRLRSLHPRRKANIATPSSVTLTNAETSDFESSTGVRIASSIDIIQVVAPGAGSAAYNDNVSGTHQFTLGGSADFVVGDICYLYADHSDATYGWARIDTKTSGTVFTVDTSLGATDAGVNIAILRAHTDFIYSIDTSGNIEPDKLIYTGGDWDSEVVSGFVVKNGDGRDGTSEIRRIASISTTTETDDTISWSRDFDTTWARDDKFYVVYSKEVDRSGAWISTGQKFYIAKGSLASEFLDLGTGSSYSGERWERARIANNLTMFVNDKFPARVIRLDLPLVQTNTGRTIAGLIAPTKTEEIETQGEGDSNANKSWFMASSNGSGALTSEGVYKVMVRAVNLDDNAYSRFVPVYDANDTDSQEITLGASDDTISIYNVDDNVASGFPMYHERWTHIEMWRTQDGGSEYFLEKQVEVSRPGFNENNDETDTGGGGEYFSSKFEAVVLSDTAVAGLSQATDDDFDAGLPPPICKQAVSLDGVTLCFGRAAEDKENPTFYSNSFFVYGGTYVNSTKTLTNTGKFASYTFASGDNLVVEYPPDAVGTYAIASSTTDTLVLTDAIGADYAIACIRAYIQRPYEVEWPYIESDEDVWYSRTDQFAPESFLARTLQLSYSGDTFMKAVAVGRYVAVIMKEGVHLLYLEGTELLKDTVSVSGDGTRWGDSVVVYRDTVFWATSSGPKMMRVSNAADDDGHRGIISYMPGAERVRAWFFDAFENNYSIDAGIATTESIIRFRKKTGFANVGWPALDFNYQTGVWSQVHQDNGIRYVSGTSIGTSSTQLPKMYSVTSTSHFYRLFYDGTNDQYASAAELDGLLGDVTSYTSTSITWTGNFESDLAGDFIYFISDTASVNGQARQIATASSNTIEFTAVSGLGDGDYFCIGGNRFRMKYAPIVGSWADNLKTVDGLACNVRPDTGLSTWDDPPTATMKMRLYRDYIETADAEEETGVSIFDDDDVAKTDISRVGTIETQGRAIEFELELNSPRVNFKVERSYVRVREEGDDVADQSSTE